MAKRALITGIAGQDGSYLAELLLGKGYEVYGIRRRSSSFNTARIEHLLYDFRHNESARLRLEYADLADSTSLIKVLYELEPDEIYNLGAQSHVHVSFEIPEYTGDVTGLGATRILEAVRQSSIDTKFYQASSSEMFGSTPPPQSENTRFHPRSPYAAAKVYAHNMTVNYREAYGLKAWCGILFNHESPRRGENFVTRKITLAAARIARGLQDKLYLGNLDARRDWGYAPEYVEAMWMMLQHDEPQDFVIATGQSNSVQDFVEASFEAAGLNWREHVEIDPRYLRPAEVDSLIGDASLAKERLGWEARTSMKELAKIMVIADIEAIDRVGETVPSAERRDLPPERAN